MKLTPGLRFVGGPDATFEVTGEAWSGRDHVYFHAKKVFRNFRYPALSLDEAPADEALDVLIRRPRIAPDPASFEKKALSTLPRFPYFLDWIDLIDSPEGDATGPWLVFADPHGRPTDLSGGIDADMSVGLAFDALAMLDALHRVRLTAGAMDPADFLPRGPGGWYFLGTDRIRPAESSGSTRDDLMHWARLTESLMRGGAGGGWPSPGVVQEGLRESTEWLFERVNFCLNESSGDRPTSVVELERGMTGSKGPVAALRRLLGRARGRS